MSARLRADPGEDRLARRARRPPVLGECTSSTPNCRSTNRMPGSTDWLRPQREVGDPLDRQRRRDLDDQRVVPLGGGVPAGPGWRARGRRRTAARRPAIGR